MTLTLHATCDEGLEGVLAVEIEAAGGSITNRTRRGVSFHGTCEVMWRVNLCSRVASRVLRKVCDFRARTRDDLYQVVSAVDWQRFMTTDQTVAVDSTGRADGLRDPRFIGQVTKDAICDRFRRETGRRPSVDRHWPDLRVNVHLNGVDGVLSVDSSGERLHRRGYRRKTGEAPLRETLAAGMLALAGWDGSVPLTDPMCGSGTIPIEAALIARRYPPGLLRTREGGAGFGFQRRPEYDAQAFEAVADALRAGILPQATVPIVGSDNDARILTTAKANADRAGVDADITWSEADIFDAAPAGPDGSLVTNPPYGARLGDVEDLEETYRALGDAMKQQFRGATAWVLCGEPALAKRIGLRASRRIPLFNGPIECRLLRFELWSGSRKGRWSAES